MTKVEFLKKLFKTENVRCGDCGQMYWVNNGLVWVDNLRGGRMSVKVKTFFDFNRAVVVAKQLKDSLLEMDYPIDAATKVDVYTCKSCSRRSGWGVRIRCDRPF